MGADNPVTDLAVTVVPPDGQTIRTRDNLAATVRFANGSVASLVYSLLGHPSLPKERAEIFAGDACFVMDDFRVLTVYGLSPAALAVNGVQVKGQSLVLPKQDKGWQQELVEVARAMRGEPSQAIPFSESVQAMRLTFEAEALSRNTSLSFAGLNSAQNNVVATGAAHA